MGSCARFLASRIRWRKGPGAAELLRAERTANWMRMSFGMSSSSAGLKRCHGRFFFFAVASFAFFEDSADQLRSFSFAVFRFVGQPRRISLSELPGEDLPICDELFRVHSNIYSAGHVPFTTTSGISET